MIRLLSRKVIGPADTPYMIRWTIISTPWFRIYLHKFVRSDYARALHDHPWSFASIILRRGYDEVTVVDTRSYHAGNILFRPAEWRHRVVLRDDKPAWTIVFCGPRTRRWGFWPNGSWCWWRKFNPNLAICEDGILFTDGED